LDFGIFEATRQIAAEAKKVFYRDNTFDLGLIFQNPSLDQTKRAAYYHATNETTCLGSMNVAPKTIPHFMKHSHADLVNHIKLNVDWKMDVQDNDTI
jgi:hypothetical protein